jgi:hypothetical protein
LYFDAIPLDDGSPSCGRCLRSRYANAWRIQNTIFLLMPANRIFLSPNWQFLIISEMPKPSATPLRTKQAERWSCRPPVADLRHRNPQLALPTPSCPSCYRSLSIMSSSRPTRPGMNRDQETTEYSLNRPNTFTKINLKPRRYHFYNVVLFIFGTLFPPLGQSSFGA